MRGLPAMSANDNMVADSLIVGPWSEEEVEKAHTLRDVQYERDEIVFDFPASLAFSYHGSVGMKKQGRSNQRLTFVRHISESSG